MLPDFGLYSVSSPPESSHSHVIRGPGENVVGMGGSAIATVEDEERGAQHTVLGCGPGLTVRELSIQFVGRERH